MVTDQVYSSSPLRSVMITGRAVPTTVWSRANRNIASRIAPRISSFWRGSRGELWPSGGLAGGWVGAGRPAPRGDHPPPPRPPAPRRHHAPTTDAANAPAGPDSDP